VLLVEDNTEALPLLQRTIGRAVPGAAVTCCNHNQVVDDDRLPAAPWDLILVDALAPLRDQYAEPGALPRSHLAGVEVAQAVQRAHGPDSPRTIAYSAAMADARINVPLWELRQVVASRHPFAAIQTNLPAIVAGDDPGLGPPTDADYGDLGLGSDARVVEAIDLARSRPDIWSWVAGGPYGDTQRTWVLDRIHPVLGTGCPRSTRHIIGVLRAVTRLGPS
jgi:hypothetical protein